jgi:hypothetical protein
MVGKQHLFRYIGDEESQNDFFVSLLAWSLEDGPEVLNAIHDDLVFSNEADVVATQRNGLSSNASENPGPRILDWVIRDTDKLVGYESKTGNSAPDETQLRQEYRRLEANSGRRDVYLFVFSDQAQQPASVEDSPAEWLSWYQLAERVLELNTKDKAIQMLQDMFREEEYDGFTGFTDFTRENRWLTKHGSEFVELAFDVNRHLDGLEIYTEGNTHLWHSTSMNLEKLRSKGWSTINQAYHIIHYHPVDGSNFVKNYYRPAIFLPALENDLRVYMDINPNQRGLNKEFVQGNASTLSHLVEQQSMHLLTSWNSFNTPNGEFLEYKSADEIENVLTEKTGKENWRRLLFGWSVSVEQSPRSIILETAERVEELHELFFEESKYFTEDELPEW